MTTLKKSYLDSTFLKTVHQVTAGITFSVAEKLSDWNQIKSNFDDYYLDAGDFPLIYATPQTKILVAKRADKVVGSISLIQSGSFSLPLQDSISIASITSPRHRVLELTDLVINDHENNQDELKFALLKYSINYIEQGLSTNRFILSDTFGSCGHILEEMGFGCLNKNFPRSYNFRNGVKTCFYYGGYDSIIHKLSKSTISSKNKLADFLMDSSLLEMELHNSVVQSSNSQSIDPEILKTFFPFERTSKLPQHDLRLLNNCYIGKKWLTDLIPPSSLPNLRTELRHSVQCDAIQLDNTDLPIAEDSFTVVSVAKGGVGFFTDGVKIKKGSLIKMRIEIGNNIMSDIEVKVGNTYQGMITGKVITKGHYWNRYHRFLDGNESSAILQS